MSQTSLCSWIMSENSVTLQWELPFHKKGRETAELFIETLKEHDPKALPRKYGLNEPLKASVEDNDFSGFFDAYDEAGAAPFGDSVHFINYRRFSWGGISFSDPRDPSPRSRAVGQKRVRLYISYFGRDFETDKTADTLEKVFVEVARSLGAFYGIGYLETGLERRGARLYSFTRYPLPRSTDWLGVPQIPGWLIWFGPPYADALRASCEGLITANYDEGYVMRRGTIPQEFDALKDGQPIYPSDLTARLCEQTLSGRTHSIFPPEVTVLDPRMFDGPAKVVLPLDPP